MHAESRNGRLGDMRGTISNVSDTARWMAACRARESARPDALFDDRLAARLAGDRGQDIARAAPASARSGWPWVIRTRLIDELILACVAEGCDRVVNLAAGLDARPYRLALPAGLRWIEVDLPAIVEEKEGLLQGEAPRCELRREKADLADSAARASVLERSLSGAERPLVITEGLLGYLETPVVDALVRDLRARGARWWITDLSSPMNQRMFRRAMGRRMENAPLTASSFPDGVAACERLGFRAREIRSIAREALRLRRVPLWLRPVIRLIALQEPDPRRLGHRLWYAVVRFES
jgi:methyltransferase (TIGR00027 family)